MRFTLSDSGTAGSVVNYDPWGTPEGNTLPPTGNLAIFIAGAFGSSGGRDTNPNLSGYPGIWHMADRFRPFIAGATVKLNPNTPLEVLRDEKRPKTCWSALHRSDPECEPVIDLDGSASIPVPDPTELAYPNPVWEIVRQSIHITQRDPMPPH